MRLIDAEKLEKEMNELCGGECECCVLKVCPAHNQPTAYDVDKVVEQLSCEKCSDCLLEENCTANFGDGFMEKIREIVKAGGVNE